MTRKKLCVPSSVFNVTANPMLCPLYPDYCPMLCRCTMRAGWMWWRGGGSWSSGGWRRWTGASTPALPTSSTYPSHSPTHSTFSVSTYPSHSHTHSTFSVSKDDIYNRNVLYFLMTSTVHIIFTTYSYIRSNCIASYHIQTTTAYCTLCWRKYILHRTVHKILFFFLFLEPIFFIIILCQFH